MINDSLAMTEIYSNARMVTPAAAMERGLEPGYAEDKWGPWKSHKLLLSEALKTNPAWANRHGK